MTDARPNARAAAILRGHLDRWLELLAERDRIDAAVATLKRSVAEHGFDPKALAVLVKKDRESEEKRARRLEAEARAEIYAATLGLDFDERGGLSERARRSIAERLLPPDRAEDGAAGPEQPSLPGAETHGPTAADMDEAMRRGADDFAAGLTITQNPYAAGDPRRAVWDMAWCAAAGGDGMDIPAHLRRPPRRKPDKGDAAGEKPGEGGGDEGGDA